MKTCFLSFNLMQTSIADYYITLSNELAIDNKVIIITSKIRDTNIKLNDNITVLKWPSKRPTAWKDFWFLFELTKKRKPVLMISLFGSVNMFLIVGWILGVKTRVAWISTLSSQYPQKTLKVYRKSMIYSLATHIITNSNATKNDAFVFFKIPLSKITILPNSVKDYTQLLQGISIDANKLLYVGRLHSSKGIDVLIKAFSQLINIFPNLHLDIIGHGPILKELQNFTISLGLSKKISFLGEKNKESVLRAYKTSYCTIIPSNSEAFGFVVIEAMSASTCVIGANNTGIKEIIINEKTGLLFETGNVDDLAKKITRILLDSAFRDDLANYGYERYINNYEIEYAVNRDTLFFNQLIK